MFRSGRDADAGERATSHDQALSTSHIAPGTTVHTNEYDIYSRLQERGDQHHSVNHGRREYARDDDGDGFHEVHVNTRMLLVAVAVLAST